MPLRPILTRRDMLARAGTGFGLLALAELLAAEQTPAASQPTQRPVPNASSPMPDARRPAPMFRPRARRVIFLYMPGGPSHVDLFDPKPRLAREAGQPLPFEKPRLERTRTGNLLPSPWKFTRCGQSGIEVSELLPKVGACV